MAESISHQTTFANDRIACDAARASVALFDVSDRTQIEMTGGDRSRFLHGFTTNDIKRLKPGQGCETFLTSLKGKVVAHLFVFCTENSLWLDGTPHQQESVLDHLRKFLIVDDVQLVPHGEDFGELFVTGPISGQLLQVDGSEESGRLRPPLAMGNTLGHITREMDGVSFSIRRVDMLGTAGYLLSGPRSRIAAIMQSLLSLGVPFGTSDLFESLRIEAGFPRYGSDITDDHLVQEVARTKQCVSFNKGCYLGQETVARLDALGHTNRELRRLQFESGLVPSPGTIVWDDERKSEVGTITSSARSISATVSEQTPMVCALGMIKRVACAAGTLVKIQIGEEVRAGRVL